MLDQIGHLFGYCIDLPEQRQCFLRFFLADQQHFDGFHLQAAPLGNEQTALPARLQERSFAPLRRYRSDDADGLTDSRVDFTAPADGAGFNAGDSVTFSGTASDAEDGDLTASLSWTSSLDGAIGSGGSFSTAALTPGPHVITASVTDSGGLSDRDAMTITGNAAQRASLTAPADGTGFNVGDRSEERRVGKECRSRWSPYH